MKHYSNVLQSEENDGLRVIPVYNHAKFLDRAVQSALSQPETGEVLLVEDGSRDESLNLCRKLERSSARVILLRHPNGENRGAGASRNLGLKSARFEFIAFLDADDYYLPGRFKTAADILNSRRDVDGVYEATELFFDNPELEAAWPGAVTDKLRTLKPGVPSESLFDRRWASGKSGSGFYQILGLTLRRDVLRKAGYFNESLRLHQDTEFFYRLELTCRLVGGRLERPVAMARRHGSNRWNPDSHKSADALKNRFLLFKTAYYWMARNRISRGRRIMVFERLAAAAIAHYGRARRLTGIPARLWFFGQLAIADMECLTFVALWRSLAQAVGIGAIMSGLTLFNAWMFGWIRTGRPQRRFQTS